MRMETIYLVTAETEDAIRTIASVWGYDFVEINDCSFEVEGEDPQIFQIMERVMKTVHWMETTGRKENFCIVGTGDSDYDFTIFTIEYSGDEPLIKASCADPEENEDRYAQFFDADYDDIPKLLKRNKNRNFKQAIKDELPLGGFLDMSYDEWVSSILEN